MSIRPLEQTDAQSDRPHKDPSGVAAHGTYPALDGLRALAVLMVVATHSAFTTGRYERGWGNNALARMDSGVAVFFVLSGFLLVRPWLAQAAGSGRRPSLGRYALRRVARIVPAYVVAILACFTLLQDNARVGVWDWVRHLGFAQIYRAGWLRAGLTQTWSLAAEASFYLILPLIGSALVLLARGSWRPGRLLLVTGAGLLVPVPWYVWTHSSQADWLTTSGFWLPGYAGWFTGGMLLAIIRTHLDRGSPPATSPWWAAEALGRHPWTCWALAAVAYFAAMTPVAGPRSIQASTAGQAVTKQTLYLVMAVALVWPAVFGRSQSVQAVFGNRVMRYAGDISYGVFLYHLLVLDGVMNLLDNPLWTGKVVQVLPLTLAGSVALAALSFRYLERPVIVWAHGGRRAVPRRR